MNLDLLWLVPLLPLAGSAINGAIGKRMGRGFTSALGVGSVWLSFLVAVILVASQSLGGFQANGYPDIQAPFYWFDAGVIQLKIGLLFDPLSAVMMLIVTGVGALIHTYSMAYMEEDPDYNRYFAYLNLFTFSMLILVLADSFLLMFVGWELVGLCSYLLIGFWYRKRSATDAGKKAFIVNRVGDWAFVIGMILTFIVFVPRVDDHNGFLFQGIFDYLHHTAADSVSLTGSLTLVPVIALLLFIGATGKSAQLPVLHIWLPDAMEGPTPVSALIHAATMVTAGVYMVARCHLFFVLSPAVMELVAWVGAITAFVAATTAVVQTDIKRVLAYSTISQIGFMFIGAGVGAFTYSIFHLMTHAFFKALLFLGAGAVIHALHNEQDMRKMGGLQRRIPVIGVLMGIGVLTIAGIIPFAGFWSKDYILGMAAERNVGVWAVGTVSAFITAFYMARLWLMTFHGEERWKTAAHAGVDLHPTSPHMLWPMVALGVLSVVGGIGAIFLPAFLGPVFADAPVEPAPAAFASEMVLMGIALVIAFAGILLAWVQYGPSNAEPKPWMARNRSLYAWLANAWFIDRAAHTVFASGGERAARLAYEEVELEGIDRAAGGLAAGVARISRELRVVQSGIVGDYALAMGVGAVCVVFYFLLR